MDILDCFHKKIKIDEIKPCFRAKYEFSTECLIFSNENLASEEFTRWLPPKFIYLLDYFEGIEKLRYECCEFEKNISLYEFSIKRGYKHMAQFIKHQ